MYTDYAFSEKDIDMFKGLIPDYYLNALEQGHLMGLVVVDDDPDYTTAVGIILYRITFGYIEIVWVAPTEEYDLPDYGADMVRRLLNKARIHGNYRGVFGRFRKGSIMSEYFPEEEFMFTNEWGGVYRFKLRDVKKLDKEHDSRNLAHCVALGDADSQLKSRIISNAEAAKDPVPISHPIKWDDYDQELSYIFKINDEAEGIILVENNGEELVISLLYAKDPVAAIALLKHSFHIALEKYGEDCKVACPVISRISEELIKKIVNNPQHEELVRAEADFPVGKGNLVDFLHYSSYRPGHLVGNNSATE